MESFFPANFAAGLFYARPEMFLTTAACIVLILDLFLRDSQRWISAWLSIVSLAVTAGLVIAMPVTNRILALADMFVIDPMGQVLKVVTLVVVIVAFIYSEEYLRQRKILKGEYYVLGLFATLGILVLISAANLISIYLGLEVLSLSLYAMVAFDRDSGTGAEAAIKYFVLGALASGTLLYGMSIVYGVTGSLDLGAISLALREGTAQNVGLLFGLSFLIVGIAFKFGAVPFHMWIPDVYQGAPTCVTLFVGSAPKIGSFALTMRLLAQGLSPSQPDWTEMLIVLAVLSIVIGNVVAIAQTNLKRMLAYSTISHVGFILLGILAGTQQGYRAAMYYTITYVIMATGSFGMILLLSRQGFEADTLEDFKGLNSRSPWFAAMMAMLMFSTAGVPPFVGFWAKLGVIQAVLAEGYTWIAVLAVLFSVVGVFYYLRIIKLMYFDEPTDTAQIGGTVLMRGVLSVNALAVAALGLVPSALLALCAQVLP